VKLTDRSWKSKAPRLTHTPAFDGIRGVGIIGVMIGHSFPVDTLSFACIVDIFFVISGFLITSLLLQEHRNHDRISLRKFYARRSLRLMPLLYVLLAVVSVGGIAMKAAGKLHAPYFLGDLAKEVVAAGLYVHNLVFPLLGGPWLANLWTLSLEEQFYLLVGVVMMVALVRGGIRWVTVALVIFIAFIQLTRLFGIAGPWHELALAVWLQRPDSLGIGVLAAIINAHIPEPLTPRAKRVIGIGAWVGVVCIFVAVWSSTSFARNQLGIHIPFYPGDQNYLPPNTSTEPYVTAMLNQPGWVLNNNGQVYWFQWGFTLASWSFLFITLAAFRIRNWFPNKIMSWKPLVLIGGLLSYGLYLWHYPVQVFTRLFVGTVPTGRFGDHYRMPMPAWCQLLVDCLLPFAFAVPTYFLVEKKALQIKNRFQVEKTTTAADMGSSKPSRNGDDHASVGAPPDAGPPATPATESPGAS
jgi:peptidoglycan/LPS O-acetylase OafA/YrhL